MSVRPLLLVCLVACTQVDVVAVRPDGSPPIADAAMDAARDAQAGFCEGGGPLVLVGDGRLSCSGAVAQTTFRYAICTCEGMALSAPVTTDAFDSREGPYTSGEGGGSVGTNGRFDASADVDVGGGLDVGGSGLLFGSTDLRVRARLQSAGPLNGDGLLAVGGDASVNGDLRVEDLFVGGTVRVPADAVVEARGIDEAPRRASGSVTVAPPCDCAAERLLDIAALVAAHASVNDNDSAGLSPDALTGLTGDARVTLPCGRYHVDRIDGEALTLEATGRVALFVAGDLALGELVIELAPGAEVDLFIAGNVLGQARWTLGDVSQPANARIYVGGDGTLELAGGATFAGNVYAPRAELVTPAAVEVFGSLFARRIAASGPLTVHYDRALGATGEGCPTPGPCESCLDCGNQACVAGACGECASDTDCCAPLVCAAGTCVPQIL